MPYGLIGKLKLKVDEMKKLKVVEKIDKPTEWLSQLIIVEKKNGDFRLCINPSYIYIST